MHKPLRLATRQSKLALWQANCVKTLLQELEPGIDIILVPLVTEGDQITDRPLAEFGGKGLFIKNLEQALLKGDADFAVHSMKDMPPVLGQEFCIPAILARAAPYDVLVAPHYRNLKALPTGARVGTSSVRRAAQLKHWRPDVHAVPIRGNIDTRLHKLIAEQYDALILAQAGLERLGLAQHIKEIFTPSMFLPSVGQGALGIECLKKDNALCALLKKLNHQESFICVQAERAMNAYLGAHCDSPVGSFASIENNMLILQAEVLNHDGSKKIKAALEGSMFEPEPLGRSVAENLLEQGAKAFF
jgi:hydroxymethylbilane synthase